MSSNSTHASEWLSLVLSLGCGILAVSAFLFWRKSKELASDWLKTQNLVKTKKEEADRALESNRYLKEELRQRTSELQSWEKEKLAILKASELAEEKLEELEERSRFERDSFDNKISHYKQEAEALTEQLVEMQADKKRKQEEWRQESLSHQKSQSQEIRKQVDELQTSVQQLRRQNRDLEAQNRKIQAEITTSQNRKEDKDNKSDFEKLKEEFIKTFYKLQKTEHLYQIMKGHREMLEERSENWEKALRLIATWVLSERLGVPGIKANLPEELGDSGQTSLPENLGSLVSLALEKIRQGHLVDDEFTILSPKSPLAGSPLGESSP